MYEGLFGLTRRPFSVVPHADDFVAIPQLQEALESLAHCVSHSRGIAIVTSSPGMGKTVLCKHLAQRLADDYRAVFLSTADVHSRRALIQAILFELSIDYVGLSEQEARLRLIREARDIQNQGRHLVLIVDEAHLLGTRLFEELRTLTDRMENDESLVRLVLCGQFELEEKLTDPALSAFNQRVGVQVCLEPLSLDESAQFLSERLRSCGVEDVFSLITETALELICRASDGNLRCLSQLTDHAMLLAFAEEQRPVNEHHVRTALDDLKELPLHWNDIGESPAAEAAAPEQETGFSVVEPHPAEFDTDEFLIPEFLKKPQAEQAESGSMDRSEPPEEELLRTAYHRTAEEAGSDQVPEDDMEQADSHWEPETKPVEDQSEHNEPMAPYAVFEVGPGADDICLKSAESAFVDETLPEESSEALFAALADKDPGDTVFLPEGAEPDSHADELFEKIAEAHPPLEEIPVHDYAAMLDRKWELPEDRQHEIDLQHLAELIEADQSSTGTTTGASGYNTLTEAALLATVEGIRHEILEKIDGLRSSDFDESLTQSATTQYDVVTPCDEPVPGSDSASAAASPSATESADSGEAQQRDYEQLFSRLRRRRRQASSSRR